MRALAAILATALAVGPGHGAGERADLRARQRTLLVLRVLGYDRNLAARAPREAIVAVLFRPGAAGSERERDEVLEALARLSEEMLAKGRRIRGAAVPVGTPAELSERLAALRPAAAWLCGTVEHLAAEIAPVAAARKVPTLAGSRAAVEAGIAVGIVPGSRRAVILVNAAAARAQGADLDAALLGVAELVTGRR
jgi:hypothetical protein